MNLKFFIVSILFGILISGCATAYQKVGMTGGYSETRLADNVFKVHFKGNGYTARDRAADFALLRSSELALENGFKYFVITDSTQNTDYSSYTTPTSSTTNYNGHISGNNYSGYTTTHYSGGNTILITKPSSENTIICFKEKPNINGLVYDAVFIKSSIKTKYGIK